MEKGIKIVNTFRIDFDEMSLFTKTFLLGVLLILLESLERIYVSDLEEVRDKPRFIMVDTIGLEKVASLDEVCKKAGETCLIKFLVLK